MDKYIKQKDKGLVTILNNGTIYALSYKRFNPETGEALEDEVTIVNDKDLVKEKETLQARMDAIDAFLSDLQKTPITPPSPVDVIN